MKKILWLVSMLCSLGLVSCASSSDGSKDTTGGNDTVGDTLQNRDTDNVDTLADTLPLDTLADTLPDTQVDLGPDTTDVFAGVDTFHPDDTVQVDTVYGPPGSCRAEAGNYTVSCEYYWDNNTQVASLKDLCTTTQKTWSDSNICAAGALGYCEDESQSKTIYCYPAQGMDNATKIEFCKLGCPVDTFVTL